MFIVDECAHCSFPLYTGALQYEAKLLLNHCIESSYFSGDTMMCCIDTLELGYMEADNRPALVTTKTLRSADNRLGQNGEFQRIIMV